MSAMDAAILSRAAISERPRTDSWVESVEDGRGRASWGKLDFADLKVAIVHDWIITYAGSERVLEQLLKLFPHEDRRGHFSDNPDYAEETAFRSSTLQGGYMMIAARAMGFDIGAMSGFSNEIVDEEFFAGTTLKSNFLCNIGYADETGLFLRLPRFEFEDVCSFA